MNFTLTKALSLQKDQVPAIREGAVDIITLLTKGFTD